MEHLAKDVFRAVARDFCAILAGVRMGRTIATYEHFINDFALFIDDVSETLGISFALGKWFPIYGAEYFICYFYGIGS
jgi:hypothetical protein